MNDLDFKNKMTEKLHKKLLKIDKGDYQNFLDKTINEIFDGGYNGIFNNTRITFDSFQAIEVYSRSNKKNIEKIFKNFMKLCKKNEKKYSNLKNAAAEYVYKIAEKIDYSYVGIITEFIINCNLKYISQITMSIDCSGSNLFKLIFNCRLTDFAKYKYWIYACPNVIRELEIKKEYHIGKQIINLIKTTGNQRKRQILHKHTHNIYKEINKYLSTIAPGIFSNIYKKIPSTMIATFDIIPEYLITKNYAVYINQKHSNFFDDVILSNNQYERFVMEEKGNSFITIKSDLMPNNDIIMKYFRKDISLPTDLAWINIIYYILHDQNHLIEMLKNDHYENHLYGKTINIKEYKKKMRKIEPLLRIINTSYNSEEYDLKYNYYRYNEFAMKFNKDNIIRFYDDYKKRIDYYLNKVEKEVILIKEIYFNNYTEVNSNINKKLLWISAVMAFIAIFQVWTQCQANIPANEFDRNMPTIEKELFISEQKK